MPIKAGIEVIGMTIRHLIQKVLQVLLIIAVLQDQKHIILLTQVHQVGHIVAQREATLHPQGVTVLRLAAILHRAEVIAVHRVVIPAQVEDNAALTIHTYLFHPIPFRQGSGIV